MIKQEEIICNNGVKQIKTYSDENKYILQVETGNKYDVACDNEPLQYTYKETDELIEEE